MTHTIRPEPLTAAAFAPFGTVLSATGDFRLINAGLCRRHHDLARPDIVDGAAGISVFLAEPRTLPYAFDLIERHPLGSQAFIPMTQNPFLVIVAETPDAPPPRLPDRRRAGHPAAPRHMARRPDASARPRPVRCRRPDRRGREP